MSNLDLNTPVTNPRLAELLAQSKLVQHNPEALNQQMNLIFEEIANRANLLAITTIDDSKVTNNGNGTATFNKGATISFHLLGAADGSAYLPLFTDWENINMDPIVQTQKISAMVMPFDQVADMMNDNLAGVVVNPFNENLAITKAQILHIANVKKMNAGGVATEKIQKDTPVKIGEPGNYPTDMVNSISAYAKKNKNINAIHLKLMEKEGELVLLLIVDFAGNKEDVFPGIAEAARPHIPQGYGLGMIPISDSFGQKAADNKPFYVKKKGLFGF